MVSEESNRRAINGIGTHLLYERAISIGCDLRGERGLGSSYGDLQFFRRQEKRLRRAQRAVSRKQKGSNNRRIAQRTVAKIHARIADQRRDFIEQETTRIVRESQAVYVEDLNLKGMAARGGRLGKSVLDQSLGRFVRTLEAKCTRYGRTFARIDRWFPSTQLCSRAGCGRLTGPKGRKQLHVRAWTCTECGTRHDRDENAEANLRAAGRKRAAEMQHEAERQNACGEARQTSQAGAALDEAGTHPKPSRSARRGRRESPTFA